MYVQSYICIPLWCHKEFNVLFFCCNVKKNVFVINNARRLHWSLGSESNRNFKMRDWQNCCCFAWTTLLGAQTSWVSCFRFCGGVWDFCYRKSTLGRFWFLSPKMHVCVRAGVLGARKYFTEPKPLVNSDQYEGRRSSCLHAVLHRGILSHTRRDIFTLSEILVHNNSSVSYIHGNT